MPGKTKKLMQRRRFVKRLQEEKQGTSDPQNEDPFDPNSEDFFKDEVDLFHDKREISLDQSGLLEPVNTSSEEDEEEEVMGLRLKDSEDEEDHEGEEEDEDFEDDEIQFGEKEQKLLNRFEKYLHSDDEELHPGVEGEIPISDKAWGKKKNIFYHTDYVDDELGGSDEEEMAEEEEKEALALQQRLAEQFDEQAYLAPEKSVLSEDQGFRRKKSKDTVEDDVVVTDLSRLSKEEKLQILAKEAPEIFQLLEDYKTKLQDAERLRPLLLYMRQDESSTVCTDESKKVTELLFQSYLVYTMNIAFYLKLKAERRPVRNHPVIARIAALRENIQKMKSAEAKLFGQLEQVLGVLKKKGQPDGAQDEIISEVKQRTNESAENGTSKKSSKKTKKKEELKFDDELVATYGRGGIGDLLRGFDPEEYYRSVKAEVETRKRKGKEKTRQVTNEESYSEEEADPEAKRAITYQIARNKGLTPKRKKEQRNPRVKHKKKYEKAKKRRTGQIRPVMTEEGVYGGERSGIRSTVSRSIKLK